MKQKLIKNELELLLKEDLSTMILEGKKTSAFGANKSLFNKLKIKYPNVLKSIKHLVEISKRKNNINDCLKLFFCECGNEKCLTSKFCSNRQCIAKNKSVKNSLYKTMIERYGTTSYNNQEKIKQTNLKRYGVENPFASKDPRLNGNATKKIKYGNENYTNTEKRKQTNLQKYGVENYLSTKEARDKIKNTMQQRYGVDNFLQSNKFLDKARATNIKQFGIYSFSKTPEFKYKCKKTWQQNLGVDHPMKCKKVIEKVKQTNIKRYGKEYYSQTDEFKKLFKDENFKYKIRQKELNTKTKNCTLQKDLFKNDKYYNKWLKKFTQTMNDRYSKQYFTQTKEYKDLYKNKEWVKSIHQKIYETQKKNNSFNKSTLEDKTYNIIKTKFPDAIHHYTDDLRYQYECDIYIPSKDLFIECHYHWTHGSEPFDKNNTEHINKINHWVQKATEKNFKNEFKTYYKQAIYIWTKLDPKKLQIMKDNNLNYEIFYSENDFKNWFNKQ